MDGCSVPSGSDLTEVMNKAYISRLLSDNYTLLIIFIVITVALSFVLVYFVKDIKKTLYDYNKYTMKSETNKNDTDEVYVDDAETEVNDPTKYQDPSKAKFFKNIDQTYKEYNLEKSNYIKSSFNKENDDYIDSRLSYKKYDDYVYEKKQKDVY